MAGGLFGGAQGSNPAANSDSTFRGDSEDYVTHELSPGGLFSQEGRSAEGAGGVPAGASASIAEEYAEDAGQWAVGPTDFQADTLKGYSDTNNSKYYSEQSEASANEADADRLAAQSSAQSAAASATEAAASANAAAGSATAASASATEAAASASAAAASETAAAASAAEADSDARRTDENARATDSDARDARLSRDEAQAAATEADSDRCFVEAIVSGDGPCADEWMSTDPDAPTLITQTPNGVRILFTLPLSIPNVLARNTSVYQDFTPLPEYYGSGAVPAGEFAVSHLLGDTDITFGTPPPTGARIDVFVYDSDKISAERSAEYIRDNIQYERARVEATVDIVDSDAEAARDWQEWSRHWARGDSSTRSGFWVGKVLDSDDIAAIGLAPTATIYFDSDQFGNSSRVPFTLLGLGWSAYQDFDRLNVLDTIGNDNASIILPPLNNQTFVGIRFPVGHVVEVGDRLDIFEDEPSDSDASHSAFYQAERARYFAELFSDSEIEIRAGFGLEGGRTYRHNHPEDVLINIAIDSDVTATREFVLEQVAGITNVSPGYGLDSEQSGRDKTLLVDSDIMASIRYVDELVDGQEDVKVGYGLDSDRSGDDKLIFVDSDVMASIRYVDELVDGQEDIKVGYGLDSDRSGDDKLVFVDSDVMASVRKVDSDIAGIQAEIDERFDELDAVRAGFGLDSEQSGIVKTLLVDSEVIATREYVDDAGANVLPGTGIIIDSEVVNGALQRTITVDSDYIRDFITNDDSEIGTFLSHTDTPNSYDSDVSAHRVVNRKFVTVNNDSDRLVFADPFAIANNRLTSINGLTIRSIGTNFIEFASFAPSNLSLEVDPSNSLNWDQPNTGFTFRGTNNADFQETFLTGITNFTVNSVARSDTFPTYTNYAASRSWPTTTPYIDTAAWSGGAVSIPASGTINASDGSTYPVSITGQWNAAGWQSLESASTASPQNFDVVLTNFQVTARPVSTTTIGNITEVELTINQADSDFPTPFGNTFFHVFGGQTIYHDTSVRVDVTGLFTKPTTVSTATDRSQTLTLTSFKTPTTAFKVWYLVLDHAFTAADLGTLSNSGYALAATQSGTSPARARTQYGNGQTGVNLYVVCTGTISSINETTNTSFPIAQPIPTPTVVALGHADHTVNFNVYQIPLADNAGNFYTIT